MNNKFGVLIVLVIIYNFTYCIWNCNYYYFTINESIVKIFYTIYASSIFFLFYVSPYFLVVIWYLYDCSTIIKYRETTEIIAIKEDMNRFSIKTILLYPVQNFWIVFYINMKKTKFKIYNFAWQYVNTIYLFKKKNK